MSEGGAATGGQEALRFSVTLNESDALAISLHAKTRFGLTGGQYKWLYWCYMALVFGALYYLAGRFFAGVGADAQLRRWGLVTISVALGALFVSYPWYFNWKLRRSSRGYQSYPVHMDMVVDGSGWNVTTPTTVSTMEWAGIERAVETRGYFILYVSRLRALVVPKPALAEPQQEAMLRNLIRSKVSDYKVVKAA